MRASLAKLLRPVHDRGHELLELHTLLFVDLVQLASELRALLEKGSGHEEAIRNAPAEKFPTDTRRLPTATGSSRRVPHGLRRMACGSSSRSRSKSLAPIDAELVRRLSRKGQSVENGYHTALGSRTVVSSVGQAATGRA